MKTPSTELFQLIKSLSPQEKKYFKQYSTRYSEYRENAYGLLFDAIDEQSEYNEELLKQKFKKHAFIKQLSVAKNYLFERIVDSLVSMHNETDEVLHTLKLISRYEVLHSRKNLLTAALAAHEKAERYATERNKLTLVPHISRQKNQLISRIEKKFENDDFVTNAEAAFLKAQTLANYLEYEMISVKANILFARPAIYTDPAELAQLNELMAHPLMSDESKALSFQAWYHYSRTKYRYYIITRQMDLGLQLLVNAIEYLRRNKTDTHNWQVMNYRFYNDLFFICMLLRRYKQCEQLLAEVETFIAKKYAPLAPMIHECFNNTFLLRAATANKITEALATWNEKRSWWISEKNRMEPATFESVFYALLKLHFLNRDWKNAILIFNEMNDSRFAWSTSCRAHFYWLMIQYEIDNLEILKNQAQNVSEWFKKHNVTAPLDKTIFSYFKKLPSVAGNEEKRQLFSQFRQALTQATSDENADTYYDLIKWLESKIAGISFADYLRHTAQNER